MTEFTQYFFSKSTHGEVVQGTGMTDAGTKHQRHAHKSSYIITQSRDLIRPVVFHLKAV